jgi:hypothetical protein
MFPFRVRVDAEARLVRSERMQKRQSFKFLRTVFMTG